MKGTHLPIQFAHLPKDYNGLCRLLTPRPIRNKVDLENVTRMTDALAGHKLTADQEDYFDLLCRLVEDYEREQGGDASQPFMRLAGVVRGTANLSARKGFSEQ